MDRLVFTANTAMSEYRLDRQNMTHELANVSTTGFKKPIRLRTGQCVLRGMDLIRGSYQEQ